MNIMMKIQPTIRRLRIKGHYFLVPVFAAFALAGCMTAAQVQTANPEKAREALSLIVSSDRAKVYFVNGKQLPSMWNMKHQYPSDVYVNEVLVGSMNKENVLVLELKPGTYNFHWNVRSTDPIDKKAEPQRFTINLIPGQILVLRGDYDLGAAGTFGLLGSFISAPKTSIAGVSNSEIEGKVVVVPQSCPASLCLQ